MNKIRSLLSLLPLFCMVVLIRDLENITFDTPTFCTTTLNMASNNNIIMGIDSFDTLFQNANDNFDKIRGHSLTLSTHSPRILLMSLSNCKEEYTIKLEK